VAGLGASIASRVGAARAVLIDTPPPTVSGSLPRRARLQLTPRRTYSHATRGCVARTSSTRWVGTTNGLPTERRVQNYFHVKCEPRAAHEPAPGAADGRRRGAQAARRRVSRASFIELCLALTTEDEKAFKALWQRLGLSIDWSLEYSTISAARPPRRPVEASSTCSEGSRLPGRGPDAVGRGLPHAVAQAEVEDARNGGPSTTCASAWRAAARSWSRRRARSCCPPASASPRTPLTSATAPCSASAP